MSVSNFLMNRRSSAILADPAPDEAVLRRVYAMALRAPDHAQLKPMRWILIRGEARHALGELFEQAALARQPALSSEVRERTRRLPLRAPLIIAVVARLQAHPKVPEIEQWLSAGCGAFSTLLGLEAEGYGGIWRTGEPAHDPRVMQGLGLSVDERLVGFLYVGTPGEGGRRPPEGPAWEQRVSDWSGTAC